MKAEMVTAFILENYERDLFARVQSLKQSFIFVKEYSKQFQLLCTRTRLKESTEQQIDCYI